jgi:RNA polymerase sporulation-specific sigma factor
MLGILTLLLKPVFFLISYISGSGSFPKPLTREVEKDYLKKIKNGDGNAKNTLIEHNLRLVAHIAKKYQQSVKDPEDLISIGTIGLMKGVESYNPEKSPKLSTYVSRCIENEILMLMRQNKKLSGEISLDDTIGSDKEGNQITLMSVLSSGDDEIFESISLELQIKNVYEKIKAELDPRETEVLKYRFGLFGIEPLTQREIAQKLDISRSYVSRIEKKAIDKLRKTINGEDGEI